MGAWIALLLDPLGRSLLRYGGSRPGIERAASRRFGSRCVETARLFRSSTPMRRRTYLLVELPIHPAFLQAHDEAHEKAHDEAHVELTETECRMLQLLRDGPKITPESK